MNTLKSHKPKGEKMNFLDLIKKQRSESKKEAWTGKFVDYLEILKENPEIVKLAARRLNDSITSYGVEQMPESDPRCKKLFDGDKIRIYNYFRDDFYGHERVIAKLMRFLKSASLKGEESRQVLLLMGPVGSGKSALADAVKKALEKAADPVYHLDGCPVREEPLHLLPRSLRDEVSNLLGVHIEGDLCPVCRHRLMEEFNGEYENFPVVRSSFSQRARRGIAVVPPMDANSQDVSALIGSEDISKLDKYSENDPRVLSLDGAFNVGNRGVVEFVEIFKNEIEFLHTILTATQEKNVPTPGKNSMLYFDGVILSHCNEAEWNRFKSEHTNEAILDRVVKIEVPYVLELTQEMKIYEKMLRRSDFKAHLAPHTIKVAAMFSVMSRLKPSQKCDLLTKMKIYDGQEVVEKGRTKKVDIKDLREEAAREGMDGISTRFITKAIDSALTDSDKNFITPMRVIDALIKQVKEQIVDEEKKKSYLEILQKVIREEYLKMLEGEIAKAFVTAYEEQAQSLFDNYLDNAEAFTTKQKMKDRITSEEREPDEKFMRAIEEQIGIVGSSRDGFRADVTAYMFAKVRRGQKVDYKSYEPLKEAIESYLIATVKDLARIVTKSKSRDNEQQKKYSEMVETMVTHYGYTPESAEEIITFASNNLWRDS
jgi:serine protein kinase